MSNEGKRQLGVVLATALMIATTYITFGAPIEMPPFIRLAGFAGGLFCWAVIVAGLSA